MGKKGKNGGDGWFDSDDDENSVSSSSTVRSDLFLDFAANDVQSNKAMLLDRCIEALYEKRGCIREQALSGIIGAFNSNLQHKFVENKCVTLLHHCLNSIKKGSEKEASLAAHAIGLLALTTGPGDKAEEILKEALSPISQALKSRSESAVIVSLLECLAIITFVGGYELEETEKSMQLVWQVVHLKLGPNVVATKPSPAVITTAVSSWSFLLTTMIGWGLNPNNWQESISYFSSLLDKDDRSVRIAAGQALALIFEFGNLEKFFCEAKASGDLNNSKEFAHIEGLRGEILNQVRTLSMEAGGKASSKKDLNTQRNLFRDILEFLEDGYSPETSTKIGKGSLNTTTWCQRIQLNFIKHFLGGGFLKHMQENEFLRDFFGFKSKKKVSGFEHPVTSQKFRGIDHRVTLRNANVGKRLYKSPNSFLNKDRTESLNKQRMLSQARNTGYYALSLANED